MNQPRMNVESFNLDHRTVAAPYVRLADTKVLPQGDTIVKYDVRFTQPNVAHLDMKAVHSIEHLFAEHSRNHSARVIDFSPMGCQTGFYLILQGQPEYAEVLDPPTVGVGGDGDTPQNATLACADGRDFTITLTSVTRCGVSSPTSSHCPGPGWYGSERHSVAGSPSSAANGRPDGSVAPIESAKPALLDASTDRMPW